DAIKPQVSAVVEISDDQGGEAKLVVGVVAHLELPEEMLGESSPGRSHPLVARELVVTTSAGDRERGLERVVLEVAVPVDLVLLRAALVDDVPVVARNLALEGADLAGVVDFAAVPALERVLEDGVLEELLLHHLGELHAGHLQQPDRLLQLRCHHQLLRKLDLLLQLHPFSRKYRTRRRSWGMPESCRTQISRPDPASAIPARGEKSRNFNTSAPNGGSACPLRGTPMGRPVPRPGDIRYIAANAGRPVQTRG